MSKRVLFAWQHGGGMGHAGRIDALASGMSELGWECTIAAPATKLQTSEHSWRWRGTFECAARTGLGHEVPRRPMRFHGELLAMLGFADGSGLRAQVDAWSKLIEHSGAELVICDAAPSARLAARVLGRPSWVLGHGFEIPPSNQGHLADFMPWLAADAPWRCISDVESVWANDWARALGAEPNLMGLYECLYADYASLMATWPALDHAPDGARSAAVRFVGPLVRWSSPSDASTHAEGSVNADESTAARVLIYLGWQQKSCLQLLQSVLASGASAWVVGAGRETVFPSDLYRSWPKLRWSANAVDLRVAISWSTHVVCHGGMGLVGLAHAWGRRLHVLGSNAEQKLLTHRLTQRGTAMTWPVFLATLRTNGVGCTKDSAPEPNPLEWARTAARLVTAGRLKPKNP